MPNYKEMYLTLFRETTKAIAILQQAQQQAEELYIADEFPANISAITADKAADRTPKRPNKNASQ